MVFIASQKYLGGYSPMDGTLEFYSRIHSIIDGKNMTVIDIGAGRGQWFVESQDSYIRNVQFLKPNTRRLIGIDVDPVVLDNLTTSENRIIYQNRFPLENESADAIIADWVFEHIEDVENFAREVNRVLKPGGYLFARTPHKYNYVSIFARIVSNNLHAPILKFVQPSRPKADIFPTRFRLNTLKKITKIFPEYENYSYIFTTEPAYYFGKSSLYNFFMGVHKYSPSFFAGCLYVFLKKRES